jgi:hypothetical protein
LAGSLLSESTLAERDMALVLREAELNRREAALRRAEQMVPEDGVAETAASAALEAALEARIVEVERREHELQMAVAAVEAQRALLESVQHEYEQRLGGLGERTREVEAERNRLRDEQAQLVCASLELEDAGRPAESGTRPAALAPAAMVLEIEPAPRPRAFRAQLERHAREMRAMLLAEQPTDAEWWSKQLGTPLEAA